jgi:adhesin/invasin
VEVNDAIAPGEILRLTGTCLGALEPASAGSTVLIDDVPAPLLRVQSAEILAIVPRSVAGKSTAALAIDYLGGRAATTLDVQPAVPGIFTAQATQAAALNQDFTLNAPGNAAPVGSVVALFLTGAGLTDPPLDDGVPPAPPFPPLALPVEVRVSGTPAEVLYAGAAPGLAGVAQVNIRIPAIPPSDAALVKLTVGGIGRDQPVTLSVN